MFGAATRVAGHRPASLYFPFAIPTEAPSRSVPLALTLPLHILDDIAVTCVGLEKAALAFSLPLTDTTFDKAFEFTNCLARGDATVSWNGDML